VLSVFKRHLPRSCASVHFRACAKTPLRFTNRTASSLRCGLRLSAKPPHFAFLRSCRCARPGERRRPGLERLRRLCLSMAAFRRGGICPRGLSCGDMPCRRLLSAHPGWAGIVPKIATDNPVVAFASPPAHTRSSDGRASSGRGVAGILPTTRRPPRRWPRKAVVQAFRCSSGYSLFES